MNGGRGQLGQRRQSETPRPVERRDEELGKKAEKAEEEVQKKTKENLGELKKEVLGSTSKARGESIDRAPAHVKKILEMIEKQMEKMQNATLDFIDEVVGKGSPANEEERLKAFASAQRRLNEIVKKHSQNTQKYKELITDVLKTFSNEKGELPSEKVALLNSVMEHLNSLYDKDKSIVFLVDKIVNNDLSSEDWEVICQNIHGQEYKKEVTSVGDQMRISITAFFMELMSPNQRYELVSRYHEWLQEKGGLDKQNAAKQAVDLAMSLGSMGVLGLTQVRNLIKDINPEMQLTAEDERTMLENQRETEKKIKKLVKKFKSSKYINGAERFLNFRTIPALILTILGVLGTTTALLSKRKISDPRTMAMIAAIGAGAHFTGKGTSAHPGTSPGPFSNFVRKFREKVTKKTDGSEKKSVLSLLERDRRSKLDQMAVIMRNYPMMNDFLMENNGIKDIHAVYLNDFKMLPSNVSKKPIIERLTDIMNEDPKNEDGIRTLQDAINRYGRRNVSRFLEQLKKSISSLPLRDKSDLETTVFSNDKSYGDYLKYKMGV